MGQFISRDLSVARHYGPRALILGIAVALVAIALDNRAFGKSFLIGSLCSSINLGLMNLFYSNLLFKSRKSASLIAFISVLIRFGVLSIPLVLGLTNKNLDIIGSCLGIFSVQMVIFLERLNILRFVKIRNRR